LQFLQEYQIAYLHLIFISGFYHFYFIVLMFFLKQETINTLKKEGI